MKLTRELSLIAIVSLPFIYLAYVWNQLPEKVPVHWSFNGEVNRYGNKIELILIPFLLPFLIYILLTFIPKIDPKNKLNNMGNKLPMLKTLLTTLMSLLALYIIYSAKNHSFSNPNLITSLIGILYILLGNYSQTFKPNYFIGIRTPWTLESEQVWKATHKLGGKIWFIGGIIVVLSSLFLNKSLNSNLFLVITLIIALVPVLYSYLLFQKQKKATE